MSLTHKQLVKRAGNWLRNTIGCSIVVEELVAYTKTGEIPDALGWVGNHCILIECKTSRNDFLADKNKCFRVHGDHALGDWRFYFSEPGIISPNELPDGWGLYELKQTYGGQWRAYHAGGERYSNAVQPPLRSCLEVERSILLSTLRRLELSRAVYVVHDNQEIPEGGV